MKNTVGGSNSEMYSHPIVMIIVIINHPTNERTFKPTN
jgi:hypothetical protein